jgi:anti-sigma regulatory factor (Ser/Thr protein kinase)
MSESVEVRITDASQVGEARRTAIRLARDAGLDDRRAGEAAIIATELANNLHRYAALGAVLCQSLHTAQGIILEILAVDSGPGMKSVDACLADGYSTGGTPGNGLGAVKRLSSEFDIFSQPESGTVVLSRVHANASVNASSLSWGLVSRPAPGEQVCGDSWQVVERQGGVAFLIADGLGHGPIAAEAALAVVAVFLEEPFAGPASILGAAHKRVASSRGAAVAAGQLDFATRSLRYCGVGNIAGSLLTANGSRGLFSHNGTIGLQAGRIQGFEYPWPAGGLLVIHSDGLQSRWDLEKYPGLFLRHPAIVSAVLARDFTRGRDDVTVLTMRARV